MSAKKPDISQIRKYLNGELDARAMYELERQAHNDPFLMDVLLGMESSRENQQPHLDALDQMLQERIQQNRKPVMLMRTYWAAAACLLIALGAGTLWLTRQKSQNMVAVSVPQVKPAIKNPKQPIPAIGTPAIVVDKKTAVAKLLPKQIKAPAMLPVEPPQAAAMVVNAYKPDTVAYSAYNKPLVVQRQAGDLNEIVAIPYDAPVGNSNAKRIDNNEPARTVTGKVVVKNDGNVLPGVPIRINGADQNIRTNANGMFSAPVPGKSGTIAINYRGYEPKQITVGDQDNIRIELVPTQTNLAEIAIKDHGIQKENTAKGINTTIGGGPEVSLIKTDTVNYALKKIPNKEIDSNGNIAIHTRDITKARINGKDFTGGNAAQAIKNLPADIVDKMQIVAFYGELKVTEKAPGGLQPVNGWEKYSNYIKQHAIMPNGSTGEVELALNITKNGSIWAIRVINGTNRALNKKAIDIIKNGPKWVKGTDPKEIQLKIVFHK